MTFEIYENGHIAKTGLGVRQTAKGTVVYTLETYNRFSNPNGAKYKEHEMPHKRYSLAHDAPASGKPGRSDFERDFLALLDSEGFKL
jgi:hypothetical protein